MKNVLLWSEQIQELVAELAPQIATHYHQFFLDSVDFYPVPSGAMYFAPALLTELSTYLGDFWHVVKRIEPERHTLVVDTIFDTGRQDLEIIHNNPGAKLSFAHLIRKSRTLQTGHKVWYGAQVPEVYVYGYGLDDSQGLRREYPYIGHD